MAACAAALMGTLVLVYLELPLRAGVFRAPLVYAKPDTWDGFWYIALAEQFRGALNDPLGDIPRKLGELAELATAQLGFLAPAVVVGFLATVVRHPRYALLTGSAMIVTVLFNASYSNADIEPLLPWPGLLGLDVARRARRSDRRDGDRAGLVGRGAGRRRRTAARRRPSKPRRSLGPAATPRRFAPAPTAPGDRSGPVSQRCSCFRLPAPIDARAFDADRSHDTSARRWVTRGALRDRGRRRRRQLVEHVDSALVRTIRRRSPAGHHDRRRSHPPRP